MTDDNTPATKDYAFEGHACLTGDCPHDTQAQCLNAAFDAGRSEADEAIKIMEHALNQYTGIAGKDCKGPTMYSIADVALTNLKAYREKQK